MRLANYRRDPARIRENWVEQKDRSVVCREPCKIVIPARYQDRTLAIVGSDVYILGIFAAIMSDPTEFVYGVSMTNAMMQITPNTTQSVMMDGDEYLEFSFEAGSRVIASTDLVKKPSITYQIFEEFISKGKLPWFIEYDDLGHLFQTAAYHSGKKIGGDAAIFEMIVATMARQPSNRRKYYRHSAESHKQTLLTPPNFIPFSSVIYNATSTTSALLGSHASDGLVSALVHPGEKTERLEALLRR